MAQLNAEATMRLWTPAGFREDEWRHADSPEVLLTNGRVILPLDALLALDSHTRRSVNGRLGVTLQPGEQLETIVHLLNELSLVALAFPAFSDGRSFSKAELLRSRYHFQGAIRAVGQILVDQLPHMLRLGFDEFEVSHPVLIERLEKGNTGGIGFYYQPAAKQADGVSKGAAYSWRRTRG